MMNIRQYWLHLFTITLLLLTAGGVRALTVARAENRLLINGIPTPLLFARNCTDATQLRAYRELGFNTLLVTVDSPGPVSLERVDALITAAEKEGLYILLELANGAWSDGQYADVESEEYRENCGYFLDAVIPHFSQRANLVGWVVSTVDERKFISDPGNLQVFLQTRYGTLDALNAAWSEQTEEGRTRNATRINSWQTFSALSPAQLLQLARSKVVRNKMLEDFKLHQETVQACDAHFRAYLRKRYDTLEQLRGAWQCDGRAWHFETWDAITVHAVAQHERQRPGASPAALLALASYRASQSPQLLEWWAREIRQRDELHLLFAGSRHSYRSLITIPYVYDGALTECYPGFAEADQAGQNPHAVDIARRGNQFIVLAGVLAHGVKPADLCTAMYAAAVHGAAGLCVTDWSLLTGAQLEGGFFSSATAVRYSLADLTQRNLLNRTPAPTVALVYSPYVDGVRINGRGLYGYMESTPLLSGPGTPGSLFFQLRNGASFGQFDYLSGDDLSRAPLARYQAIIMPSALDVPRAAQDALIKYTYNGGAVLADIGVGTLQATNDLYMLPGPLMFLFHVIVNPGLDNVRYNLEMDQPHSRFPRVLPGMRTTGFNGGFMIAQMAKVTPMEGTQYLFTVVGGKKYSDHLPTVRPPRPMPVAPTHGVFYYQFGKGIAIYAPFPLYRYWMPENQLYGEFHHDLFGLHATVALARPIDFFPPLAEVAAYADGSVIAWTKDQTRPEVLVRNPARRLFSVPAQLGRCTLTPEQTILSYETPGLQLAEPLPITVAPSPHTVHVATHLINPQVLEFSLEVAKTEAPQPLTVLHIGHGVYPISPGSTHRVTLNGQATLLKANDKGVLTLQISSSRCRVRIGEPGSTGNGKEVIIDVIAPDDDYIIDVQPPVEEEEEKDVSFRAVQQSR